MAFTNTSLPFNFYTSVSECGCGFGFEQKDWQINTFDQKRHGSVNLHTPTQELTIKLFGNVFFAY